jgi:hypothetical protein
MQFELWQDATKRGVTLIPADSEEHHKLLAPGDTLIWTVEADSFEAALVARNEYLGWEPYEPWRPRRYEVTVRTGDGQTFLYRVTTWLGERKAIALAAIEHDQHHPANGEPAHGLNDVLVKDLGAIDLTPDGIGEAPEGDLFDRSEGLSRSQL